MMIHAVQTGTVRVHERQRRGRGRGLVRAMNAVLDSEWTEPLPILAWVIEHPEGLIVVDTGETARTAEPGYFPRWHLYYRLALREYVEPEEEIGPALRSLGLSPGDVRWVVMTHLHTDHAGGLHYFPDSEILVSAREHATARGFTGRLLGYLPHRWPSWFEPTVLDLDLDESFQRGHPLTSAGDVRLVATPGHTAGHLSVIVEEEDHALFLAGDASYTVANLLSGEVDGLAATGGGEDVAAATLARIRNFASARPTVYLPSHDPVSFRNLSERRALQLPGDDGETPLET